MKSCHRNLQLLRVLAASGQLSAGRLETLRDHARFCPLCRQALRQSASLDAALFLAAATRRGSSPPFPERASQQSTARFIARANARSNTSPAAASFMVPARCLRPSPRGRGALRPGLAPAHHRLPSPRHLPPNLPPRRAGARSFLQRSRQIRDRATSASRCPPAPPPGPAPPFTSKPRRRPANLHLACIRPSPSLGTLPQRRHRAMAPRRRIQFNRGCPVQQCSLANIPRHSAASLRAVEHALPKAGPRCAL